MRKSSSESATAYRRAAFCLACAFLTAGCLVHETSNSGPDGEELESNELSGVPPNRTPPQAAGPSIEVLEQDAEVLRKLLGYNHVAAFEFRGTWLACWLECEVDGEVVATTPRVRISPTSFSATQGVDFADGNDVTGWVTIWGNKSHWLHLTMRGQLPRDGSRMSYPFPVMPKKLTIPPAPADPDKQLYTRGSGGLNAPDGSSPITLPSKHGETFTLLSYHWEERQEAEGPVLRKVRVSLKALRPTEEESEGSDSNGGRHSVVPGR